MSLPSLVNNMWDVPSCPFSFISGTKPTRYMVAPQVPKDKLTVDLYLT
jgi:hypothetical protein